MPTDAFFASGADLGMCAIGFLNDSSDEAGEFRQFASQKRSTKFNVREESIARIGRLIVKSTFGIGSPDVESLKSKVTNLRKFAEVLDGHLNGRERVRVED